MQNEVAYLYAKFSWRRRETDAVLSDASESSSIFWENFFDHQSSFVVVIVEDLEVLRRLDDSCLTEPGDLRLKDKFEIGVRFKK